MYEAMTKLKPPDNRKNCERLMHVRETWNRWFSESTLDIIDRRVGEIVASQKQRHAAELAERQKLREQQQAQQWAGSPRGSPRYGEPDRAVPQDPGLERTLALAREQLSSGRLPPARHAQVLAQVEDLERTLASRQPTGWSTGAGGGSVVSQVSRDPRDPRGNRPGPLPVFETPGAHYHSSGGPLGQQQPVMQQFPQGVQPLQPMLHMPSHQHPEPGGPPGGYPGPINAEPMQRPFQQHGGWPQQEPQQGGWKPQQQQQQQHYNPPRNSQDHNPVSPGTANMNNLLSLVQSQGMLSDISVNLSSGKGAIRDEGPVATEVSLDPEALKVLRPGAVENIYSELSLQHPVTGRRFHPSEQLEFQEYQDIVRSPPAAAAAPPCLIG